MIVLNCEGTKIEHFSIRNLNLSQSGSTKKKVSPGFPKYQNGGQLPYLEFKIFHKTRKTFHPHSLPQHTSMIDITDSTCDWKRGPFEYHSNKINSSNPVVGIRNCFKFLNIYIFLVSSRLSCWTYFKCMNLLFSWNFRLHTQ